MLVEDSRQIALRASVAAWENKRQLAKKSRFADISLEGADCPLCQSFIRCLNCPVLVKTGRGHCNDTPYGEVYDALREVMIDVKADGSADPKRIARLIESIEAELEFLRSLLSQRV